MASVALCMILAPGLVTAAFGQSGTVESSYNTLYEIPTPDVVRPVTIEVENHVYHPGDDVTVTGFVWTELVERIDALDIIVVELKDGQNNVVARENTTIGADGRYSATLSLLDSASTGTYSANAHVELEADALGLVEAITSAGLQSTNEFVVAVPKEHKLVVEDEEFGVQIASNSGINSVQLNQVDKKLTFFVEGNDGTEGMTEIRIPKALLSGNLTVFIDQNLASEDSVLLKEDTTEYTVFEINYIHSIHRIEVAGTSVVPEFPVAVVIMTVTMAAMIVTSRLARSKRGGATPASP